MIADGNNMYLTYDNQTQVILKRDHKYYYQVQTQLLFTGYDFVDFFVWTEKDYAICRITYDEEIINEIKLKSSDFFKQVILPELVVKYYTEPILKTQTHENGVYCYCKLGGDEDNLIGCDDNDCTIQWFHLKCVNIKNIPKGKWYCPECRRKRNIQKIKKKNVFHKNI